MSDEHVGTDPPRRAREQGLEAAYALNDLEAVVSAFRRTRDGGWLSLARTLAVALDRPDPVDPACRPEATPRHLPPATVFLLGATETDPPGCLGHVAARPASWTVGGAAAGESVATIRGGSDVVEKVMDAVLDSVRGLSPDAVRPEAEVVIPVRGEGDSHALAVAIAAMHALLRCRVPHGLAATGSYDATSRSFLSVPEATLTAKLAAAERWGVRTLVVVDGQPLPERLPSGIRVVRVSSDPGALPLLVLRLASECRDADRMVEAWQRALALYDLRVASSLHEPIESVMEVTAPFVNSVAAALARDRAPTEVEVRDATATSGVDPIIVGLAADIRSRACLHAGRSVESAWWDQIAAGLRGLGDLPDGMLGDHIMLQQPSHRSVVAIDLGDMDDPAADDPGRHWHPHAVLDDAIAALERRWRTRHQSLLAIFATNSRWRRRLYLARRDLDLARFTQSTSDLLRWRDRWEDLLEAHAARGLRMGNTNLARQWNYVLEHAVTEVSLRDLEGFRRGGGDAAVRRGVSSFWRSDPGLMSDLDARRHAIESLSAFDLRGLLQWIWLTGESLPEAVLQRCRAVVDTMPATVTAGVAEWWWRFTETGSADRDAVHTALRRSIESHLVRASDHAQAAPAGIHRLISLRRAAMLDLDGVAAPGVADWVEAIQRPESPESPASLVRAFDDLRSQPADLLIRTPY